MFDDDDDARAEVEAFFRRLLREELHMIHADIQAQLDRVTAIVADLPTQVTEAVANAEAAKDSDHADDVAGLTSTIDALKTAVDAIAATKTTPAPATPATPDPVTTAGAPAAPAPLALAPLPATVAPAAA